MNPFEMVAIIVVLAMITSIILKYIEARQGKTGSADDSENHQLKEQVAVMQERIHTLEAIVTDAGAQTAAQIEALRERPSVRHEDKVQ